METTGDTVNMSATTEDGEEGDKLSYSEDNRKDEDNSEEEEHDYNKSSTSRKIQGAISQIKALRKRIVVQKTELTKKEAIVKDNKNEISSLRNEIKKNKEMIGDLNREIKKRNEINESITTENRTLRGDRVNRKLKINLLKKI